MTIKEVCEKYGLTQDTLRYYERIGMIPPVSRTAGRIRDYQEEDLKYQDPLDTEEKAAEQQPAPAQSGTDLGGGLVLPPGFGGAGAITGSRDGAQDTEGGTRGHVDVY